MTVRDYSTTANDNTSIEGIALADTMLANALDNAIRQAMADTANFLLDIAKPTSSTGSANAYALSTGGTVGAYADNIRLAFMANFSNTGACTVNIDAVGVVDLKIYTSAGVGNPASGQIQSGGVYDIMYVAALGDFVVLNATQLEVSLADDTTPQLGGPLDTNSFSVDGSQGADVASAAELLLLRDGNLVDITGTTTITSIENTADAIGVGAVYTLQFDGAVTLTHHATDLILLGGANITTAAGDVAVMQKYAAGDWRMLLFNGISASADWEAGTSTKPSLLSPADNAAAITALSPFGNAYFHAQEQQPSGTAGASATGAAFDNLSINQEVTNVISGMSIAAGVITAPAGDYYVRASAPAYKTDDHVLQLRNVTDGSDILIGTSERSESTASYKSAQTRSFVTGRFTLASGKDIRLRHWAEVAGNFGEGHAAGVINIYAEIELWKVG